MYQDELFDEDVLDVFYFGFGQLRTSLQKTVPELWVELVRLEVTPLQEDH